MPCPKLSPLQARFAACLAATIILILLYYVPLNIRFAYALEFDSVIRDDHNHPIISDLALDFEDHSEDLFGDEALYHAGMARRAPEGMDALANNQPRLKNINMGETQFWVIPKEVVTGPKSLAAPGLSDIPEPKNNETYDNDLSRRSTTVYITLNTCIQPILNETQRSDDSAPPQLRLYYSEDGSVKEPGPNTTSVKSIELDDGYGSLKMTSDKDIYIGVFAPSHPRYSGIYNYEVAASIDSPFHSMADQSPLVFVDSDSKAALLLLNVSGPATGQAGDEWVKSNPPQFTMFANNMNHSAIFGLQKSYCGLSKNAQIVPKGGNLNATLTMRGGTPREQFYINNLNSSSTYYGVLARNGNSTMSGAGVVGGGGKVWKAIRFTTKQDGNCALVFDLKFCSEVAYAVPSNPTLKPTELEAIYDDNASNLYENFTYSLQQIPCDAPPASAYSLASNCQQCAHAYKQWLCAVTIPRCQDFSSTSEFLRARNTGQNFINGSSLPDNDQFRDKVLTNSSRNPIIDSQVKPGPYKEILPCEKLCFDLVQACPSAMGFACPTGEFLKNSYGTYKDGDVTCSYLGAAYSQKSYGIKLAMMSLKTALNLLAFWGIVWGLNY